MSDTPRAPHTPHGAPDPAARRLGPFTSWATPSSTPSGSQVDVGALEEAASGPCEPAWEFPPLSPTRSTDAVLNGPPPTDEGGTNGLGALFTSVYTPSALELGLVEPLLDLDSMNSEVALDGRGDDDDVTSAP